MIGGANNREGVSGGAVRLITLRLIGLLMVSYPLLGWAVVNVLCSTPLGSFFAEKVLENETGLPSEIGSLTWSPWAGFVVSELEFFEPERPDSSPQKLLSIAEISLDPSWTSLLKGKKRWDELVIKEMEGRISLEQLRRLLSELQAGEASVPLAVAPSSAPVVEPEKGDEPEPQDSVDPEPEDEIPAVVVVQKPGTLPVQPAVPAVDEVVAGALETDLFEGDVILEDCSFEVFSEAHPLWKAQISQLRATLPLWGKAREGLIQVGLVDFGEGREAFDIDVPISWAADSLLISHHPLELFGIELELFFKTTLVPGLPFAVQVTVPDQQLDLTPIYGEGRSPFAIAHLTARMQGGGYFSLPSTIQGEGDLVFENLEWRHPKFDSPLRFYEGAARARMGAAGLSIPGVRIVGDETSILMNGFATRSGNLAATVRVVTSPEHAQAYQNRVAQSGAGLAMPFQPFVTPDRYFFDLQLRNHGEDMVANLGPDDQWVSFSSALSKIWKKEEQAKILR